MSARIYLWNDDPVSDSSITFRVPDGGRVPFTSVGAHAGFAAIDERLLVGTFPTSVIVSRDGDYQFNWSVQAKTEILPQQIRFEIVRQPAKRRIGPPFPPVGIRGTRRSAIRFVNESANFHFQEATLTGIVRLYSGDRVWLANRSGDAVILLPDFAVATLSFEFVSLPSSSPARRIL